MRTILGYIEGDFNSANKWDVKVFTYKENMYLCRVVKNVPLNNNAAFLNLWLFSKH